MMKFAACISLHLGCTQLGSAGHVSMIGWISDTWPQGYMTCCQASEVNHLQQGCKPLCLQSAVGDSVEGDNFTANKS